MVQLAINRYGDPERKYLRIAVLFSLLVHAGLLPWDFVGEYRQEVLSRPLTVRIIHSPPTQRVTLPEPEPSYPPQDHPAEVLPEATPDPRPLPELAPDPVTESQQEEVIQSVEPLNAEDQPVAEAPVLTVVPPDEVPVQPASASEVAVLLLIGVNGEVLQVVWNKLPAISYETLDRMEMQLREKKYPPADRPHTLTVVVTVPK